MEQTAVEFLIEKLFDVSYYTKRQIDMFKKAKEMEKQQIIDAYREGMGNVDGWIVNENGVEQYYDETYENKKNI